ncbi:MAG: GMC family oxidoreductase [Acidobacteria bacterium]|nr:MAG: GMC family oxidoreductase [Acidobacteriota bacterium]
MMGAREADVVVIGSGFGGSISANRLALAGLKVLVLERGPWRDSLPVRSMGIERRAPFPYGAKSLTHLVRTIHVGRRSLTLNKVGMFEMFFYPGLGVLAVSAVGGGSHGWAGMLVAPQDPAYWVARHPELNSADVEKYYDKVLADMGAVRLSHDHWLHHSIWTHLPGSSASNCLPADPQPHLAIKVPYTEGEVGQVTEDDRGLQRQTCAFDGDSFLGSRGGAKASVDFIYLAPVLNNGVSVSDMCEVTNVARDSTVGTAAYTIHFSCLLDGTKEMVRAKRVILAAGTMNTLSLLFASSVESHGLSPMPSLGHTFGGNGDLLGAWFKQSAQPPLFKAAPILGRFKVDAKDIPFVALGGLPGVDTIPMPSFARKKLGKTVPILGMGADTGKASARYENGAIVVDYDPTQEPIFDEIREAIRALGAQSGLKTWAIKKPITVHQWGGACLGPSADRGVVDNNGEVYGNPGLFVADGAALPAAVGTPPSLPIAAWAHHVADRLAQTAT